MREEEEQKNLQKERDAVAKKAKEADRQRRIARDRQAADRRKAEGQSDDEETGSDDSAVSYVSDSDEDSDEDVMDFINRKKSTTPR